VDDLGQPQLIQLPSIPDLLANKFTSIIHTSCAIVTNINGDRICLLHLIPFFYEPLNKTVPRYHITVYDFNTTENKWLFHGEMEGTFIDPDFIEASDSVAIENIINRSVTPMTSAEYRNIYISNDEVGEYISMWVPFIKINNDLVLLRPDYEEMSTFVRIDTIEPQSTLSGGEL